MSVFYHNLAQQASIRSRGRLGGSLPPDEEPPVWTGRTRRRFSLRKLGMVTQFEYEHQVFHARIFTHDSGAFVTERFWRTEK